MHPTHHHHHGHDHAPNHHAHHRPFDGATGLMLALRFAFGRDGVGAFAADVAGLREGERVLDIGCGPGNAARVAIRRGARSAIGVDPANVMLRVGRLLTPSRKVDYRIGAAESLPVQDASVEVVWSLASVHHWVDVDAGIREAMRVLVPGGRFVAIEANTSPGATGLRSHGWTEDQAERFAELLSEAGFVDARVERRTIDKRARLAVVGTRG